METFLEKILVKLKFLNIGSPQLLAEFASHIGWSLGYLFLVNRFFGEHALVPGAAVWVAYSLLKETLEDGHLVRILKGQETPDEIKDFYTDLLSRIGAPLIFLIYRGLTALFG